MLTAAELSRYGRQLVLPEVGVTGQQRLQDARVLIVGAGGLGSPAALYLAAAGVGVLGIVDDDAVEVSNLHRQLLHATADIGRAKTSSAAQAIARLNPHIDVKTHNERLTVARAQALFADYHLVIDGSDNYPTRYAVNDACALLGKVWVYGSVERFSGQVSLFGAPDGPCYRCIFPSAPAPGSSASCEEIGVIGAVPGVVGSLQAVEALKWILGIGEPLVGRLLQLDLLTGVTQTVRFERRQECPACISGNAIGEDVLSETSGSADYDIEPQQLAQQMGTPTDVLLLDVREPWEWAIARIGEPQCLAMNDLPAKLDMLDRSRELVVYCHHGARSQIAAAWLREQGYRARNLAGGIDRWSREVDTSVSRY